jgi:hypothetical protein
VGVVERFEGEFLTLRKRRALRRSLVFDEAGLVLGAGTILAPMRRDGAGAEILDLSGEDRILAALTATFLAPVNIALLGKLRHASDLWSRGEKSLAQIHLAHLRLPQIDEAQAFRLFLADRLMAEGFSPRELCKQLAFELSAGLRRFDQDQPRDGRGRWTSGGDFGSASSGDVREGRSVSPGGHHGGEEREDDKLDEFKAKLGETTLQDDVQHDRPIDPLGSTPVPFPGGRPPGSSSPGSSGIVGQVSAPKLHQGQQDKHIEGTNNFDPRRSVLTDPDPQGLLDRFGGTGTAVNDVPGGQPGFRERVNFGKIIGNFVDDDTGRSYPTTNGIIHYSKKGAHIVPSNP